jgi:N-acetyl-anhydromuramyl-L-alanine amidase AmpD
MQTLIATTSGVSSHYFIKPPNKIVKLIIEIYAWSF